MTLTNAMPTSLESNIFLTEALIERLNDEWKVSALENGHAHSYKLGYDVAKRFIKVWRYDVFNGEVRDGRSIFFFIDKNWVNVLNQRVRIVPPLKASGFISIN